MKDETKHIIAKEIAFVVPLFLLGVAIVVFLGILDHYHILDTSINGDGEWLLICTPLALGYFYRLYKWVNEWK